MIKLNEERYKKLGRFYNLLKSKEEEMNALPESVREAFIRRVALEAGLSEDDIEFALLIGSLTEREYEQLIRELVKIFRDGQ